MGKPYNEEQTMGVSLYMGGGIKIAYFLLMALPHHTRLVMFLKKFVQYYNKVSSMTLWYWN
jgi:hypothetical protein